MCNPRYEIFQDRCLWQHSLSRQNFYCRNMVNEKTPKYGFGFSQRENYTHLVEAEIAIYIVSVETLLIHVGHSWYSSLSKGLVQIENIFRSYCDNLCVCVCLVSFILIFQASRSVGIIQGTCTNHLPRFCRLHFAPLTLSFSLHGYMDISFMHLFFPWTTWDKLEADFWPFTIRYM